LEERVRMNFYDFSLEVIPMEVSEFLEEIAESFLFFPRKAFGIEHTLDVLEERGNSKVVFFLQGSNERGDRGADIGVLLSREKKAQIFYKPFSY